MNMEKKRSEVKYTSPYPGLTPMICDESKNDVA